MVPVLPEIDDSHPNPGEFGSTQGPPIDTLLAGLPPSKFSSLVAALTAGTWPVPSVAATYVWGIAYVPTARNVFAEAGLYEEDHSSRGAPANPQPADWVLFDWPGAPLAHVGIFEGYAPDGSWLIWEGNTSDRLMLKRRTTAVVNGVCHVPYPNMAARQAALDFYRARDGMGENPPGSNCNEITSACGLGCVAWCAETSSLATVQGFGTTFGPDGEPTPYEPPAPGPGGDFLPLEEDGQFGPLTTRALQYNLGVDPDGDFGPISKRALQARVGTEQDGEIGPITIRALQERVGADVDGEWGPQTTGRLQSALNGHRF